MRNWSGDRACRPPGGDGVPGPGPSPGAGLVVTGATASALVRTPLRYHRDDSDITIGVVVPSTTLHSSKIDRVVRDAFVAGLSAHPPPTRDVPGVTPVLRATSRAEVARGLSGMRPSEPPRRRTVDTARNAVSIMWGAEMSRAEITVG